MSQSLEKDSEVGYPTSSITCKGAYLWDYARKSQKLLAIPGICNKLNGKQRLAVDTIEGPWWWLPVPGQGKRKYSLHASVKYYWKQMCFPKIFYALLIPMPAQLRCEKACSALSDLMLIKWTSYTFHAFCNDIIQENLSLFKKNSLDAVSELERIEYFKKLIDHFPKNHLLKRYRGDVYYEIGNLKNLFSIDETRRAYRRNSSIRKLMSISTDLTTRMNILPNALQKILKKEMYARDKIDEEKERMHKLRAAVNEFA